MEEIACVNVFFYDGFGNPCNDVGATTHKEKDVSINKIYSKLC